MGTYAFVFVVGWIIGAAIGYFIAAHRELGR